MKIKLLPLLFSVCAFLACRNDNGTVNKEIVNPIRGTWQLLSSAILENEQETFTDYTKEQQMIKIINDTHFSFLKHDLKLNKEGKNGFDAGGGRYELVDDNYTEHLDFYNDKNWEGKTFNFKIEIKNDTLIQTGIEKVESAGIDRVITEKYIKVTDK